MFSRSSVVIAEPSPPHCPERYYIWIANTDEGTVSKLCTINGKEMGRYSTSPSGALGDPSRTSVNRHGDQVVTNLNPDPPPSSVTKFAAARVDCVDRNGDTVIQTSTCADDVLAWGEDECMLWNTFLTYSGEAVTGCRATAWEGNEDPDTGLGGRVWIGCADNRMLYILDGDTGSVLHSERLAISPYGGAMDGRGGYWMVDKKTINTKEATLLRLDMETLEQTITKVPCAYGITVDGNGHIWTAGMGIDAFVPEPRMRGCVNRLDPTNGLSVTYYTGFQLQVVESPF